MKVKKIIVWFLTVFLALGALVFMPSVASLFGLVAAALIFPLEKYQRWLGCYLKKWMIITGASVLAFLMFITAPATESEQSDPPVVQQGEEQEKTPQSEEPSKEEPSENEAPKEEKPAEDPAETPEEDAETAPPVTPSVQEKPAVTPQETVKPSHQHSFKAATCTAPKTCSCGATEGSKLGHNWSAATCTTAKKCSVCGATDGSAKGHSWSAATCTTPKKCASCGATEGGVTDHNWKSATYSAPKTCTKCNKTEGSSLAKPGQNNYHGAVYTGGSSSKRFHYEANCAGKNSHEISWAEVDSRGLTACQTCVLK